MVGFLRTARATLLAGSLSTLLPLVAGAVQRGPEEISDEFLRAFAALSWYAAAQRMHPEGLADFREDVTMIVHADRSSEVLSRLLGGRSRENFDAMEDADVFPRVMEALEGEMPGLVNGLIDRRHEVLGAVAEGEDVAHVVYRVIPRLSGDQPRIEVMTMGRSGGRWGVLRSDQLDAVATAIRGLPVGRGPPPLPRDTLRFELDVREAEANLHNGTLGLPFRDRG